jgi:hypothetical protein
MMKFVEKLLAARPYRLTLQFNTGELRVVDLEPILRARGATAQSAYGQLLDPSTFCRVRFDPESRTVCWDGLAREITADGSEQPAPLDFCPDVLYELGTPLPKDAVGQPVDEDRKQVEASGSVLNDKPPGDG